MSMAVDDRPLPPAPGCVYVPCPRSTALLDTQVQPGKAWQHQPPLVPAHCCLQSIAAWFAGTHTYTHDQSLPAANAQLRIPSCLSHCWDGRPCTQHDSPLHTQCLLLLLMRPAPQAQAPSVVRARSSRQACCSHPAAACTRRAAAGTNGSLPPPPSLPPSAPHSSRRPAAGPWGATGPCQSPPWPPPTPP